LEYFFTKHSVNYSCWLWLVEYEAHDNREYSRIARLIEEDVEMRCSICMLNDIACVHGTRIGPAPQVLSIIPAAPY